MVAEKYRTEKEDDGNVKWMRRIWNTMLSLPSPAHE